MRVSLFVTCITDTMYPGTGQAVVRLLERLGHEIEFPADQTCCGQMHHNSGYAPETLDLVRRFVRVFADAETIVVPSTSCTAMIRHTYPLIAAATGEAALIEQVAQIAARTHEFSEFITRKLGLLDVGSYYPHRVTYHSSCNSLRSLKLGSAPLDLLRHVRGIDLVELAHTEECCGFGGTFAVKNAEISTAMMADKIRHILNTGAEICTAGDNSCLMRIGGGLARLRTGVRVVHLAEILAATEAAG